MKNQRNSQSNCQELSITNLLTHIRGFKSNSQTYELNFCVHYETTCSESIVVTGSHKIFGDWDPLQGLGLEWTTGNLWKNSVCISEGVLENFEYKYVCLSPNYTRWEGGNNRVFDLSSGVRVDHSKQVFTTVSHWQI